MTSSEHLQPAFRAEVCTSFFRKTYADPNRCSASFQREPWMPEPKKIGPPMEDRPFSREELLDALKKKKAKKGLGQMPFRTSSGRTTRALGRISLLSSTRVAPAG